MSSAFYKNGASGEYSGTWKNADGTAIPYDVAGTAEPRVTGITLSLVDAITGAAVNSRTDQDAFNTNGVTTDSAGAFVWKLDELDTTPLAGNADFAMVEHIATFTVTYVDDDGATETLKHEHVIRIRNHSPLARFSDLTEQMEIDADDEHFCQLLLDAVTARFETYTHRRFKRATYTQVLSPRKGSSWVQLKRYPTESITSVHEDSDGTFEAADLVTATAYDGTSRANKGILTLRYRYFGGGPGSLQVIGVGGYRDSAHVPADLRMACIRQTLFLYQRRRQLGESGVSVEGRSVQVVATDLLDDVKAVLDSYKPRAMGV